MDKKQEVLSHAWKVPTLDLMSSDEPYTIFDLQNVFCDSQQMRNCPDFINDPASRRHVIPFKPHRLYLHEVIVIFSIHAVQQSEEKFQNAVATIYEAGRTVYLDRFEALEQLWEHNQSISLQNLKSIYASYQEKVMPEIRRIANQMVGTYIRKNNIQTIEIPQSNDRITAMVCGGQASGKGSSVAQLKLKMEQAGVKWDNVVRINTDAYKPLVLTPGSVNFMLYSQLAQPEAAVIHSKLTECLKAMAESGKAPHVLIDQVFVGKDKLEFALISAGKAMVVVVSTDVVTAVERSFNRGAETIPSTHGRYEDTFGILRCHKNFAIQLPKVLAEFVKADIKVNIVDNNVERGSEAIETAMIILGPEPAEEILIINKEGIESLIKKTHINENAQDRDSVYPPNLVIQQSDIVNYFSPIKLDLKTLYAQDSIQPK